MLRRRCVRQRTGDLRPRRALTSVDEAWAKWDAWRPADAARVFAGVQAPWYVAAGWAIDLFLGGGHREHEDLEVGVPRARFEEFTRALSDYELYVPTVEDEDRFVAVPVAEAGARLETHHQTWVRERAADRWRIDLFREPSDGDRWVCRRDESIRLPYDELIEWTSDGIPYGRPEIVLLFKATRTSPAGAEEARERDEADFAAVLEALEPDRRRFFRELLARVAPEHEWLARL